MVMMFLRGKGINGRFTFLYLLLAEGRGAVRFEPLKIGNAEH